MKKTYRCPATAIICLECESIVASSTDYMPIEPNKPGTAASRKQHHVWGKTLWGEHGE